MTNYQLDGPFPKIDPLKRQRSRDISKIKIAIRDSIPQEVELTMILIALAEMTKEYSWELAIAIDNIQSDDENSNCNQIKQTTIEQVKQNLLSEFKDADFVITKTIYDGWTNQPVTDKTEPRWIHEMMTISWSGLPTYSEVSSFMETGHATDPIKGQDKVFPYKLVHSDRTVQ